MPEEAAPRVFMSYSHDSAEHRDRVLALADRLRADGINAVIDQYFQAPPEGWPAWCAVQIDTADFVLMICTETYLRRVMRKKEPGLGYGVLWEGRLINQYLYNAGSVSAKFVPLLLADGSDAHVPLPMKGGTIYRVETPEGYESLLRLLSDQPLTAMPPFGAPRPLPRPSGQARKVMPLTVFIAHARREEDLAESLAQPLRKAGYEVSYEGTVLIGESVVQETERLLLEGAPVVLCGTVRACGNQWVRRLVNAARQINNGMLFILQMEEEADVEIFSFGERISNYWKDPDKALTELISALHKYYPVGEANTSFRLLARDSVKSVFHDTAQTSARQSLGIQKEQPQTRRIFVSFCDADEAAAVEIVEELENSGFRCWISNRDVLRRYQEEIVEAIDAAPAMVAVFSSNANQSDEMKKELSLASRAKIPVFPVRIEMAEPQGAFKYEFSINQYIDLFRERRNALERLTTLLKRFSGPSE